MAKYYLCHVCKKDISINNEKKHNKTKVHQNNLQRRDNIQDYEDYKLCLAKGWVEIKYQNFEEFACKSGKRVRN